MRKHMFADDTRLLIKAKRRIRRYNNQKYKNRWRSLSKHMAMLPEGGMAEWYDRQRLDVRPHSGR